MSRLLIQLYIQKVDPLIRIMHVPSFLHRLQLYQARSTQSAQFSPPIRYPSTYLSDQSGHGTYPNPPSTLPSQFESNTTNRAFETLLFAVYYAAIICAIGSPSTPYFGKDVDLHALAASYKREIITNTALVDDTEYVRSGSLEMLQAVVLMLVSTQ